MEPAGSALRLRERGGGEAAPLRGARITHIAGRADVALLRAVAATWPGNAAWAQCWAGRELTPQSAPVSELRPLSRTPRAHGDWARTEGSDEYVRMLADAVRYVSIDALSDGRGTTFVANRPGGRYVLVGPQTFSAAQDLANRLERETFARFVGTPTGGSPNQYGDAPTLVGAATGITALVATLPWFDSCPQDVRDCIVPDVIVPDAFAAWAAGHEPALELARTETVEAAPNQLSRERVFYFRRPSQSQPWRPFWRS